MTSKAITDSARGQMCTVRLPGTCSFDPSNTVFAHLNGIRLGHGIGIKTRFGAYCCSSCHDCLDGRARSGFDKNTLRLYHMDGVIETLNLILRDAPNLWDKFKD